MTVLFNCLSFCVVCVCVCVWLRVYILQLFQSNMHRPDREVVCDLTTCLLTEVEVDQVLPPHSVLILVCQQETQPSLLASTALSYLNRKQEVWLTLIL